MKKTILLGTIFCFIFSMSAQAKDVWEMAESPVYKEKFAGMLGRGLLNVVTCFADIPVQTVNGAKKNKPEILGAIGGLGMGAACTVLRAASGVIDVAGSWIPGFHGVPVSRSYDNCLAAREPAYAPSATVYQSSTPAATSTTSGDSRLKYVKK
ncbi:MAG: hypothetical protein HY583_02755 [Candidatus Omnitrophica bacterium]|nr:hypothetical protein [Candidatus Omnitrophota bacterium]